MIENIERIMWGIVFKNKSGLFLVYRSWNEDRQKKFPLDPAEPTRLLVFRSRSQARAFCKAKNEKWKSYDDEVVSKWRVKPVKVLETFKII